MLHQRDRIGRYIIGTVYPYRDLNRFAKFIRIFWYAIRRFQLDQIGQRAVALTYHTLFAVVPVAALSFAIAKGFDLEERFRDSLAERFEHHREVFDWIYHFAHTTLEQTRGSVIAGIGVIALFWTVVRLSSNIETAFNSVWRLPSKRNLFRRVSDYLSILLIMPIVLVILGSAGPLLRKLFNRIVVSFPLVGDWGGGIIWFGIEFFPIVMVSVVFTLIYCFAPNTKVKLSSALFAGIIAGIFFQLLQDGFLYVQGSIFRYNKIYGTFAVLPLFLIWVQWSWQITLFGAEISFVKQHIGSGFFDRTSDDALSHRLRREYEFAFLRLIYRNFADGHGALSAVTLFRKVPLPPVTTMALLEELCEAGVLCRVKQEPDSDSPPEFVPGQPTESCRLSDAERLLDRVGIDSLSDAGGTDEAAAALARLTEEAARSGSNRLLKEL